MGKGYFQSTSKTQKLNTRSSTEAELVAVDDMMGKILWTTLFLEGQGYDAGPSIIQQDNQSSIKLENNGSRSSGPRTRHLNIRYYLVTDRVKHGYVIIEYCPTGEMAADILTKPLQGKEFLRQRRRLLNLPDDLAEVDLDHRSVLEDKNESMNETSHDEPTVADSDEPTEDEMIKEMPMSMNADGSETYVMIINGQEIKYSIELENCRKRSSNESSKVVALISLNLE